MLLESRRGTLAVTGVALVIAVGEPRYKFSQVALPDWVTARRTDRLRAGCPAIHQDEFHMPSPSSVSRAWPRVASRQQRKLQMRNLQRKFIGSSFGRSEYPVAPRKAAVNELVWFKPTVNPISSPKARIAPHRPLANDVTDRCEADCGASLGDRNNRQSGDRRGQRRFVHHSDISRDEMRSVMLPCARDLSSRDIIRGSHGDVLNGDQC